MATVTSVRDGSTIFADLQTVFGPAAFEPHYELPRILCNLVFSNLDVLPCDTLPEILNLVISSRAAAPSISLSAHSGDC